MERLYCYSMRNRLRYQSEPRKPWQSRCLICALDCSDCASRRRDWETTREGAEWEVCRKATFFSRLCNYPYREVKSLQQLRRSVGEAIDRRSKHVCPARALSSSRVVQKSDAKEGRVKRSVIHSHELSVIFQWKPVNAKNTPSGGGGCLEAAHVCRPPRLPSLR